LGIDRLVRGLPLQAVILFDILSGRVATWKMAGKKVCFVNKESLQEATSSYKVGQRSKSFVVTGADETRS
jgi:hypothetical protein